MSLLNEIRAAQVHAGEQAVINSLRASGLITDPPSPAKQFAAKLVGATYRNVISKELAAEAKAAGLVVVYGMSDDLMEFDGAIYDELGGYNGETAYLTSAGLLQNECDHDECPHFEKLKEQAATIEALWCAEGDYSWTFKTDIPHETFEITEDGETYCRGIVFALADVKA
jgi:hypothetical protein